MHLRWDQWEKPFQFKVSTESANKCVTDRLPPFISVDWPKGCGTPCLLRKELFQNRTLIIKNCFWIKKQFWIKSNSRKLESNWVMRIPKSSKPQFLHLFVHAALSTSVWICVILCKSAHSCVCLCMIAVLWPTECVVGLKSFQIGNLARYSLEDKGNMCAEVCGGGRPLERLLELPKTSVDGFVCWPQCVDSIGEWKLLSFNQAMWWLAEAKRELRH